MKKALRIFGYIFGVYNIINIIVVIVLNHNEKFNHWFFDTLEDMPWLANMVGVFRKE